MGREKHIKLDGFATTLDYKYPGGIFLSGFDLAQQNRNQHGNRLLNQLNAIRQQFNVPPDVDLPEGIWWEVWFRKTENDQLRINRALENLNLIGVQIGESELIFEEHIVRLVKGTATQLSQSLMLLDNLSELRKSQETADFICHKGVEYEDKVEWMEDLIGRTNGELDENSVLICLLDSGVNNIHPLINTFLPNERLYSYKT